MAGVMLQGEGVEDVSIVGRSRGRIGSGRGSGGNHGAIGKWQGNPRQGLDDHPREGLSLPQIVL